ncbi:hypothetical protein [Blastococcus sp. CT_GayMR16]|uniref:hypothetical protein n=1 Tax=Blastococcus sp. CT_GayMR16 TaxID=2559607 RepID=UPI0010739E3C|nr:hypothetical protein [Blastococcus sp. CT_GayMR16]TFV89629.1 hypothetical protein E4P38_07685 [Blastococcus sp. CT_GayMR16]
MARSRSVQSLLSEGWDMPPGFARTAVAEEAVRVADAANDLDAGFEARCTLAEFAQHGGEARKALVAVTWCLAQIDAHPGRFETHRPYWALKWLPWTLLDIPDVPLEEVEGVVGEMRRRYESEGTGQDAVAKIDWTLALYLGRIEDAVEAHRRWRLVARTEYGDCRACDVASEVELALAAGERARALDIARPVLAGRLVCAEEPAYVLGVLLAPLADLGETEEAERLHEWGLRLARGNPSLLTTQAQHVVHLIRHGRLDAALDLVTEILEVCDRDAIDLDTRMWVAAAGGAVAAALAEAGVDRVTRSLGSRPSGTSALADVLAGEARVAAAAFDRRNGTDTMSRRVEERLTVRPQAAPAAGTPTEGRTEAVSTVAVPAPPAPDAEGPEDVLTRARKESGLAEEARIGLAERALAGFLDAGDAAGAARARRTIGAALLRLDRDDEARPLLEAALGELEGQLEEQVYAALDLARLGFSRAQRVDDHCRHWLQVALGAAENAPDRATLLGLCRIVEAEWRVLELGPDPTPAQLAAAVGLFAEARAQLAPDPVEVAHSWAAEANCRAAVGDLDGGSGAASTAWEVAEDAGSDEARAAVGGLLSSLLVATGHPVRALEILEATQQAEIALGARGEAAETAVARAEVLRDLGREEEALGRGWEAVDLFVAAGDRSGAAGARLLVARLLRTLGQDINAYDILSEVVAQAADDGDRRLEGAAALDLAVLNGDYGDVDEGLAAAQRALACFDADDHHARGRTYRALTDLHFAREEVTDALSAGAAALDALAEEGDLLTLAEAQRDQAARLLLSGRAAEALTLFDLARAAFEAEGLPVAVAGVDLGRADALASLGRTSEAAALAETAAVVAVREDVPMLEADALWTVAAHSTPEKALYDRAIDAFVRAGAPEEQVASLRSARDEALRPARGLFRRSR